MTCARRRLQRPRDLLLATQPVVSSEPMPPMTSERTLLRMVEREHGRDPRAHRIAHDVGAVDAEMIEQIRRVARHQLEAVVLGVVELGAVAVAAYVHGDDPPPVRGQRVDPAGGPPVDRDCWRQSRG